MFVANQRFSWLRVAVPVCVAALILLGGWGLVTSNQPAKDQLASELAVAQQQAIGLTNQFNVESSPSWRPVDPIIGGLMALGDINQDGAVDILAGTNGRLFLTRDSAAETATDLRLNQLPTVLAGGINPDAALVDINNDGHLDIVLASSLQRKNGSAVLINPGTHSDLETKEKWNQVNIRDVDYELPAREGDLFEAVKAADFDRDGDFDLVFAGVSAGKARFGMFENQISGTNLTTLSLTPILPNLLTGADALEVGDIDGDQNVDLVAIRSRYIDEEPDSDTRGNAIGGELTVCKNTTTTGNPISFSCTDLGLSVSVGAKALKLGDIDNDQQLDLVVGDGEKVYFYKNQNGTLSLNQTVVALNPANAVDLGDMDNDGDLDLLVGLNLFVNNGGSFTASPVWQPFESISIQKSALVDMDGDNDLDVVAAGGGPVLVYLNQGQLLPSAPGTLAGQNRFTETGKLAAFSSSAGDVNNDGQQDLVLGRAFGPDEFNERREFFLHNTVNLNRWAPAQNILLLNRNGKLEIDSGWNPINTRVTLATAWGDVDNDGDLDLAVANRPYAADADTPISGKNEIYLNINGILSDTPYEFGADTSASQDIKWVDINRDGRLDLVVANFNTSDQIFLNQSTEIDNPTFITTTWTTNQSGDPSLGISLATGDIDGDSFEDIIIGRQSLVDVYMNQRGDIPNEPTASLSPGTFNGFNFNEVDLTDVDRDGDLDLTIAATARPIRLYDNVGGQFLAEPIWESAATEHYNNVRYADLNNDGYPELLSASANTGINIRTDTNIKGWLNNNGSLSADIHWKSGVALRQFDFAAADFNLDGLVDIVQPGDDGNLFVYDSLRPASANAQPQASAAILSKNTAERGSNSTYQSGPIAITYNLSNTAGSGFSSVRFEYSITGGANWLPAEPVSGTVPALENGTHEFLWDLISSGFFGQTDDIVVRMTAVPQNDQTSLPETNIIPAVTAQSHPLKVSGSQIQVVSEVDGGGIENAFIFHRPAASTAQAEPFVDGSGRLLTTNESGILYGSGQLQAGDELFALSPLTATDRFDIYVVSGAPTESGVEMTEVVGNSVQETIRMDGQNLLTLFNLNVSLEWDASSDPTYLAQLERDLERTSAILFDVTNGQAALGEINVFQDKVLWEVADIQVLADNNHRPNAALGGITAIPITETVTLISGTETVTQTIPNAIKPGQIRMAATWNRYGNPGGTLGEDWPRTLAHELGHFLFFQMDHYIGVDQATDTLITPDCPGSIMTDAYRGDFSEFLGRSNLVSGGFIWDTTTAAGCGETFANRSTGRSDWETIKTYYPWMKGPEELSLVGPSVFPLNLTAVDIFFIENDDNPPITDPIFYLQTADGEADIPQAGAAQVYLYRTNNNDDIKDDDIIPLGSPIGQTINARGASEGDRLCVIVDEADNQRSGCLTVGTEGEGITLRPVESSWRPDIRVRPVNSVTVAVSVTLPASIPAGESLNVQLFPSVRLTTAIQAETAELQQVASTTDSNVYRAELSFPVTVFNGFVRVWHNEGNTLTDREQVTFYAVSLGQGADGQLKLPTAIDPPMDWQSAGFDTNRLVGSGTNRLVGSGTNRLVGSGTNRLVGSGTNRLVGSGTNRLVGSGTNRLVGSGTNRLVGSGTNRLVGSGTNRLVGSGTNRLVGSGTNRLVGSGTNRLVGSGTNRLVGSGTNRLVGSGTNRLVGSGTNRLVGSGTNNLLTFNAPLSSPDGQLILFNVSNILDNVPATNLQRINGTDAMPNWLTPVGNIYRYEAIGAASGESPSKIAMQFFYLNRDVPGISESQLKIFYLPDGGGATDWVPLPTIIDEDRNQASAVLIENGFYALAATIELPTITAGWNLIGNPVAGSVPITQALESILNETAIVYGFDAETSNWQVFDPDANSAINSLATFDFGRGYWLSATTTATLYLPITEGSITSTVLFEPQLLSDSLNPPAAFSGSIDASTEDRFIDVKAANSALDCDFILVEAGRTTWTLLIPDNAGECQFSNGDEIQFYDGETLLGSATWNNGSITSDVDLSAEP